MGELGIVERLNQSIHNLKSRWEKSRRAAYFSVVGVQIDEANYLINLPSLNEENFESLLKQLFLNSRNLGQSYQKNFGLMWEQEDFINHLSQLGSPCFSGAWERRASASVLIRSGCSQGRELGTRVCQYWREAADGLVIGLSEGDRFVRHCSVESGDATCVDVIYQDEATPSDAIWESENRWGPLPQELNSTLKIIEENFDKLKVDLSFLGISEKNLFYKLEPRENLTCGSSGTIFRTLLQEKVKKVMPDLHLRDASPVAVYGERT